MNLNFTIALQTFTVKTSHEARIDDSLFRKKDLNFISWWWYTSLFIYLLLLLLELNNNNLYRTIRVPPHYDEQFVPTKCWNFIASDGIRR